MDDLLPLSRCAKRVGVPQTWLKEQAILGRIPCLRAGSRYLFNRVAVEKILAKKAATTREAVADAR